jgi:formiminotetrahydrofolate cyclodeaminase
VKFEDYFKVSEEQLKLIEELQKILRELEDAPGDSLITNRVIEILQELSYLRNQLRGLRDEEGEDFKLLKKFYHMVGVHDEREILEELLKMVLKGRLDIPKELVLEQINRNKEFEKTLRENPESE